MTWRPSYATPAELGAWTEAHNWTDLNLALCIQTASRAADRYTARQFGKVDAPETRRFTPEWFRDRWYIAIDDLMTTDGLVIALDNDGDGTPESEVSDYELAPINAGANGLPWTGLEILPKSPRKPNGIRNGVHITATWGWTAVPEAVKTATLIQAARLLERREEATGPPISKRVDDVSVRWAGGTELDADVASSLSGYRKYWAAV